ncbi:ribosomal protection-like ABC-F family protein [Streptoalloteichus hindustanus]|uniref:Macrolide transport system ATP-binding/permease protein n=1 Tax=Streptoalloteichus hindustanus TaxID=2017 RepID=A0A1M5ERV6_STRHI|nr:ABC-F family ATP-binding cassette domain-containing protein [Streptoalloteichus hindustanus]SHF82043.1 macrolide transport system ATP-binding/permease protein [Streptoalloteichus hindustanus]
MPTQISTRALTRTYGDRIVLDSVTCAFPTGERTGVIGENGSGKSTLLRLLAGRETADHGEVVVTADGGVGYLAQDTTLPPHLTVREAIDAALSDLRAMEARMRELEAAMADGDESGFAEYDRLLTVFELRGGYDADARVEAALHGLGLGGLPHDRVLGGLSGGEQVRLRLAAILAAAPEVLLLDEPTNHLDDNAVAWLEDHLRTRRGTTIAVSHDRVFLDHVATTLVEVDADRRALVRYGNGYSGYLAEKAAARQRWAQEHEQWQEDVARQREAVATTARRVAPNRAMTDRNKMAYDRAGGRVQQSVASRVRNAEERLRRLLDAPVPPPPQPLRFRPSLHASQLRGVVLDAVDVGVHGRLAPTSLSVDAGQRVLVTGVNGAGKSTLLRVLVGELEPDTGQVVRRGRVGYLSQEVAPGSPGETVVAAFARGRGGVPEDHAEHLLSLGLFAPEQLTVPVTALSTGQRQRLALARLLTEPTDVLVLDEPSNHLSLALVEDLEAALEHYTGALVVVSHDRRFRQRWRGEQLAVRAPGERPSVTLR